MIVVDASAVVALLLGMRGVDDVLDGEDDATIAAPHLLDVEVLHVMRRLANRGEIDATRAAGAVEDFGAMRILRYSHVPLSGRIWDLRGSLTAYDATYVALAETLDATLVTMDARISRFRGHDAVVRVI